MGNPQMSQINELAPDFDITCWVQGEPSNISLQKGKVIIVTVFQVNCPGCFSAGFPEILDALQKINKELVVFWGLATAFEDFELNNLENLKKLINRREVIGETLYTLGSQGMLDNDRLSYKIPFPVAWDKISSAIPSNASVDTKNMIERDFPEFENLPESTQNKIFKQVMAYYKCKKFSAATFESYQLRGTPSTLLIDQKGVLRGKWFGSGFGLTNEIEKILNE
jgi:peroxiredoxin